MQLTVAMYSRCSGKCLQAGLFRTAAGPSDRGKGHVLRAFSGARLLTRLEGLQLLDTIDHLVLDCDGVLWRGSELLPDIAEVLDLIY